MKKIIAACALVGLASIIFAAEYRSTNGFSFSSVAIGTTLPNPSYQSLTLGTGSIIYATNSVALTDGVPSTVCTIQLPSTNFVCGGTILGTILFKESNVGVQAHTSTVNFSIACLDGTTTTTAIAESAQLEVAALSTGSLTDTWAISAGGTQNRTVTITLNANTSMSANGTLCCEIHLRSSAGGATLTFP